MNNLVNQWLQTIRLSTKRLQQPIARTLLAQAHCACCGDSSGQHPFLCDACFPHLPINHPACVQCAEPLVSLQSGLRCGRCQRRPPAFDYSHCSWQFTSPVDHWIRLCKDRHDTLWLRRLAHLMNNHPPAQLAQVDGLVFIPSSRQHLWQRGFNMAEYLAQHVSRTWGIPIRKQTLYKQHSNDQRGLSAQQRRLNLRHSLHGGQQSLHGQHLLLIDDVMTTGATMSVAAEHLKQQGARIVGCWCLARTVLR